MRACSRSSKRHRACEKLDSDLKALGIGSRKQASGADMAESIAKSVVGLRDKNVTSTFANVLVSWLMPSLAKIVDRHEAALMRGELLQVATGLALYEAETGRFPAKLADLAPKYVKALPKDRFSGKPLVYKREGKGCIVYSVGVNLIDDGGIDNIDDEDADDEKDDIVVRFKR